MKIDTELYNKIPKKLQDLFEVSHNPNCPCYILDKQSGVGASRFFYNPKASTNERNKGCLDFRYTLKNKNYYKNIGECGSVIGSRGILYRYGWDRYCCMQ